MNSMRLSVAVFAAVAAVVGLGSPAQADIHEGDDLVVTVEISEAPAPQDPDPETPDGTDAEGVSEDPDVTSPDSAEDELARTGGGALLGLGIAAFSLIGAAAVLVVFARRRDSPSR